MKNVLTGNRPFLFSSALALALLSANGAFAGSVKPCSTATVAFVKSIKGEAANVVLTRGGDQAPLKTFSPLCKGDVVKLASASESVILGVAGSGPNEIVGPTQYTVGPAQTGAQSVSSVIEDRLLPLGDRTVGQGLARSGTDPFEFGLLDLESESARIKAGNRPLWVGWSGGFAPFDLTVTDPSGQPLAHQMVNENTVVLPATNIAPGRYTIAVKDRNGRTRRTSFEAVTEVPKVENVSVPSWMGADSATMFSAFCVAAEDPYTWSYEAAQEIAATPSSNIDQNSALALISAGDPATLCPGKAG
ncbi:MAG: hypothetical protein WA138_02735 [Parvibaculum sp.]